MHDLVSSKVRAIPPLGDVAGLRFMASSKVDPLKLAYSIKEACRASSLGRSTIYAHIAAGTLTARRIGGRTIIPAESLHALIAGDV